MTTDSLPDARTCARLAWLADRCGQSRALTGGLTTELQDRVDTALAQYVETRFIASVLLARIESTSHADLPRRAPPGQPHIRPRAGGTMLAPTTGGGRRVKGNSSAPRHQRTGGAEAEIDAIRWAQIALELAASATDAYKHGAVTLGEAMYYLRCAGHAGSVAEASRHPILGQRRAA